MYLQVRSEKSIKMKQTILFFSILLVINSCKKQDPIFQKEKLGGYWEIKSVTLPDGSKKDFNYSNVIDFIKVSESSGIRTKVITQLDGSFINNGGAEKFTLKVEQDSLRLYYETPFDQWKETVIKVTDSLLIISNRESKIYTYKKFIKYNFTN